MHLEIGQSHKSVFLELMEQASIRFMQLSFQLMLTRPFLRDARGKKEGFANRERGTPFNEIVVGVTHNLWPIINNLDFRLPNFTAVREGHMTRRMDTSPPT